MLFFILLEFAQIKISLFVAFLTPPSFPEKNGKIHLPLKKGEEPKYF